MRAIAPRTGAPETTLAEEQEEYLPLTVANYFYAEDPADPARITSRVRLTAWQPELAERHMVAETLRALVPSLSVDDARAAIAALLREHPIYVGQKDFGGPMTPLSVSLGTERWMLPQPSGVVPTG